MHRACKTVFILLPLLFSCSHQCDETIIVKCIFSTDEKSAKIVFQNVITEEYKSLDIGNRLVYPGDKVCVTKRHFLNDQIYIDCVNTIKISDFRAPGETSRPHFYSLDDEDALYDVNEYSYYVINRDNSLTSIWDFDVYSENAELYMLYRKDENTVTANGKHTIHPYALYSFKIR